MMRPTITAVMILGSSVTGAGTALAFMMTTTCLIAHWPGDGNTDDVVNGNDGTLENGATFGTGIIGDAFSFDGVDDHVLIADNGPVDLDGFTELTLAARIKADVVSNPDGMGNKVLTIISKYDSSSGRALVIPLASNLMEH